MQNAANVIPHPGQRLRPRAPAERRAPDTGRVLRQTRDLKAETASDLEDLVCANLMAAELAVLSVSERIPDDIAIYAVFEARDRARELHAAFYALVEGA